MTWGPNPDFTNPTKYKIYRVKGDPQDELTFTWVGETSTDSFSIEDEAVVSGASSSFTYYVTASNGTSESLASNYFTVDGTENWLTSLSMTTSGGHPRIVWIPYIFSPSSQATGYYIYRSINTSGGPPGTFGHIATVGDVIEWTDIDLAVGSPWKVYYKVKAYKNNPYEESAFTYPAETGASGFQKLNSGKEVYTYGLYQNYPNPFNPVTTIDYELNDLSFVDLRVFNSMGEEVAVVVNTQRAPGKYSVQFNGASLASGVYFYKLTAGGKTIIKQMVLVK